MKRVLFLYFVVYLLHPPSNAQTIPSNRIVNWSYAGLQDTIPVYNNVVNIMNFGGIKDSSATNEAAFQAALASLNNAPGTIYFPAGTYLFHNNIDLRDSIVIKGDGKHTRLIFDLGNAAKNMINIHGAVDTLSRTIAQNVAKGDRSITLNDISSIKQGDWLQIYGNDTALVTSAFALGTVGQIIKVQSAAANTININQTEIRRNYDAGFGAKIKRILPVKGAGLECLYIQRIDTTAGQTTNVSMVNAVNCWVIGVESYKTNFAHIEITGSEHILVRGCYLHHSYAYGGNGQGYGTLVQFTSGDCLIENNVFEHLRHSMILQAGANGNVFAYNYSTDPFWTEPSLPTNSAGDAVLHGNYPYANLFEGNILQNIVVDNSHGINGPFNTFFRNRAQLYGVVQNNNPATDSMNYAGNEITNTGITFGNYILSGTGHFQYGNNVKGSVTPAGTNTLPETSLFSSIVPGFWQNGLHWPAIGLPNPYNTGDIPAHIAYVSQDKTDCTANPVYVPVGIRDHIMTKEINVYPNPANEIVVFDIPDLSNARIMITDVSGRLICVLRGKGVDRITWDCSSKPPGLYFFELKTEQKSQIGKLIVQH